jgi:hypothetical protein
MRPTVFEQVIRWLLVLPVAMLFSGVSLIVSGLVYVATTVLLFLFLGFPAMIAGIAEKFDGFSEDASRAVMCASLVIPGAAFVLAGAVTAPTRSLGDKVVAVMLCGVVIVLDRVGGGLLVSDADTVRPGCPWMFPSLGAVLAVLSVIVWPSTVRTSDLPPFLRSGTDLPPEN